MMGKDIDWLWTEIDRISELPPTEAQDRFDEIISKIRLELDRKVEPELYYALGYCLYMHPKKLSSTEIRNHLVVSLKKAIEIRPDFSKAKLYLAFYWFDSGNYKKAMMLFSDIDKKDIDPYQWIKCQELYLCCRIILHGLSGQLNELEQFRDLCSRVEYYDIFPVQLVNTIVSLGSEFTDASVIRKTIELLNEIVKEAGLSSIFDKDLKPLCDRYCSNSDLCDDP